MSHASSRVAYAQRERCARGPGDCPVCEREAASAAHSGCCSRNCEEGAHRAVVASVLVGGLSACAAVGPGGGAICTLTFGHAGEHVAEGSAGELVAVWPARGAA